MAGEEPIVSGMAGRYATALFDLADEAGQLDAVAGDLAKIAGLVRGHGGLARVVKSPLITREEQGRAMDAVLQHIGVSPLTRRFVGLVANKRRLFAILEMAMAYDALLSAKRGEIKARVVSAVPLSQSQSQAISDVLRVAFRRDVKLDATVDPRILGGLVVKVGSRMIDSSLATKLDRLKLAMKEA